MSAFEYFVSCRDGVAIVNLIGSLHKNCAPALDHCFHNLADLKPSLVILNFRDVPGMDQSGSDAYAEFKTKIWENTKARVIISAMAPSIRNLLQEQGSFSQADCFNNLAEVLQNIAPLMKKAG